VALHIARRHGERSTLLLLASGVGAKRTRGGLGAGTCLRSCVCSAPPPGGIKHARMLEVVPCVSCATQPRSTIDSTIDSMQVGDSWRTLQEDSAIATPLLEPALVKYQVGLEACVCVCLWCSPIPPGPRHACSIRVLLMRRNISHRHARTSKPLAQLTVYKVRLRPTLKISVFCKSAPWLAISRAATLRACRTTYKRTSWPRFRETWVRG